jgi:PAS domain S-box-containing protein
MLATAWAIIASGGLVACAIGLTVAVMHLRRCRVTCHQWERETDALRLQIASANRVASDSDSGEIRFRELASVSPIGIFETDPQGHLIYASARWCKIAGAAEERARGDGWLDTVHEHDRQRVQAAWGNAIRNNLPFESEYRFKHEDGNIIWVVGQAMPLRGPIDGMGYVGTITDITQQKRVAEERQRLDFRVQQAQRLESLAVLAGGVAHDFNNLLTGVLGNAALARQELPPGSSVRQTVEQIEKAARRAADLTKQLLAYSGKGTFVVQPINLSRLVQEMGDLLRASISKKVTLQYHFTDSMPTVEADATQLRQVVMNLILNASEAISVEHGSITVSTGVVNADRDYLASTYLDENLPVGPYAYFEVADTGCGMDEQTKSRIFDPFFTTKFTGRGLGLAAVLGIVRGHHGAIRVRSQQGRGTTITVLFPCSDKPEAHTTPKSGSLTAYRGKGTVLVADDEEAVRNVARRMLELVGFTVLSASDGIEAVQVFREHSPEIVAVLLDMTMPQMDGLTALREIRRIRNDARIILSSGFSEQDAKSRLAGEGLSGFVQKPYRPSELVGKVRDVLSS